MSKELLKKYTDPKYEGAFTGLNTFYKQLKKKTKTIKKKDAFEAIKKEDTYQLHKPIRKHFKKSKVIVPGIDDTWQADLADMQSKKDENKNFRYILTVIDVFSKFAWAVPIKTKKGEDIVNAFKTIFKDKRAPKNIHVDQGKEFYNKEFKSFLSARNIKLYSTKSELKASIVERFNRTMKDRISRIFTQYKNNEYLSKLADIIKGYNNTIHRSIKMAPSEVKKSNEDQVFKNLYGYDKLSGNENKIKILFRKGDLVRIYRYKYLFTKGYEKNWSSELFVIDKIIPNDPPFYKIKDLQDQEIEGNFYTEELQKIEEEDLEEDEYVVEKILETRTRRGKKEVLVKWQGYPDSENSWIPESNLK